MPEHRQDRVIWSPLQVATYTLGDLAEALVLLHNVRLIDDDELKRLAEKAERMWPSDENDEKEEPWPLESFDEWSELTRERDGADADAIAEQHERDRLGY
jgi:hypothetical protein